MDLLLLPPQGSARRLRRREGGADGESIGTNRGAGIMSNSYVYYTRVQL
jgi:hypothetical protein